MIKQNYDLAIIGGGPGGYTAAGEAVRAGLKTALIEYRELGGTCLHRGCIPTKTLMHSSEIIHSINKGIPGMLIRVGEKNVPYDDFSADIDMKELQKQRQEVSDRLAGSIRTSLSKGGVELINGMGTVVSPHEIEIRPVPGTEETTPARITADTIILATGAKPGKLPIPGMELDGVMNSDQMIVNEERPSRLIIVGGGVIGIEFATIYLGLGSEVTILEGAPRLLATLDREFSQSIRTILKKRGASIHTGAMVQGFEWNEESAALICRFTEKGEEKTVEADQILVAAGRVPQTEHLFGNGFSVEMNGKYLAVNELLQTSCPSIYAIGDVTGGVELAHTASAEARNVIYTILGKPPQENLKVIPVCVYTDPEIAYTGMTLEEAKEAGIQAVSKKYPMLGNGRSVLSQQERGFIKVVAEEETGRILGAQLMCARATDMIAEFTEAVANGLTVKQMADVIHPHPTYSEGIIEVLRLFEM